MWATANTAEAEGHVDLLRKTAPGEEKIAGDQRKLSRLEHDVLWRLSVGELKPSIADDMKLSVRTIDMLVESATSKLNAASPIHAVSILLRNGELGPERDPQ